MGLLAHLVLEGDPEEAVKVARFMTGVGLPSCLSHFCLDPIRDEEALREAMQASVREFIVRNEPFEVTAESLMSAFLEADRIGMKITAETGDDCFRTLHASAPSE